MWLAEQRQPVRRQVALKVIKAGMDTREVIARFEAERQALALMNHPNIAGVYDAGATPEGRPYFAMEYVHGIPITEYCDKQRLSIRERLELFMDVCAGVQHAHQKGIIHRDIKPSNVLVTTQDEKHTPKIIDFGVAKATSQRLTERTVFTELGQLIGTPEYMSPEQAEMTNLDIDTRTDVYSLGVLLYELLAGARPFDSKELRRAGLAEIQRTLREDEPPRPSSRISSLGAASTSSATNRRADLSKPDEGARRRPRLDHDEGPREGSGAAVCHRSRAGARCRTPSQRRSRARGAPQRALSREETVQPTSGHVPLGRGRRPGSCGRDHRHVVGAAAGEARRAAGGRERS